jgi:hypothetical protein
MNGDGTTDRAESGGGGFQYEIAGDTGFQVELTVGAGGRGCEHVVALSELEGRVRKGIALRIEDAALEGDFLGESGSEGQKRSGDENFY